MISAEIKKLLGGFRDSLSGNLASEDGGKFRGDVMWNLLSLGVLGASGISINILISIYYSPAYLGIFNQVYAVYIIASQVAALGVHLSAQRSVAAHGEDRDEWKTAALSAWIVCLCTSLLGCAALYFLIPLVGSILDSPQVVEGLYWVLPGVGFFALNKVLLGILNGRRRMKAYALMNGLRLFLVLMVVLLCAVTGQPGQRLPVSFSLGEFVLLLCLMVLTYKDLWPSTLAQLRVWIGRHIKFGYKAMVAGIIMDINCRVDVLVLGVFVSDREVGLYSFAAMLAEGFNQILVVLRINYNPLIARLWHEGKLPQLYSLFRAGRKKTYLIVAPLAAVLLVAFPLATWLVPALSAYQASFPVLALLMAGIMSYAGYLPFSHLLLQSNSPGAQSVMTGVIVSMNFLLNLAMVPLWGKEGAALATAINFVLYGLWVHLIIRWKLGLARNPRGAGLPSGD
ncbi:lipopolysaccharide biosynthesis protein [Desulfoferula mesophila]|uniref:Flippase n=1 Tax=Desulfoferula mesophila TaxID=3058419 RepID=A0AAU9E9E9_9BACT|nr:flippase [Desulfoferula mesophilus]